LWFDLLPEDEKELQLMYNQLQSEVRAKDYFKEKISMIMVQYKADSYYKNDTLDSFITWLSSHENILIKELAKIFTKEEFNELWKKCADKIILNKVYNEIDKQGEKALSYLVTSLFIIGILISI